MKIEKFMLIGFMVLALSFAWVKYNEVAERRILTQGLETFNLYLEAAEANDLETLSSLSFQLSETCRDEGRRDECNTLMTSAHSFGIEIEQDTLFVLGKDRNQLILANDYLESLESEVPTIIRAVIYLVREDDELKILSFNPHDGAFIIRSDESTSTLSTRLKEMVVDTDGDGLPDRIETCADDTATLLGCVETDPNKKDTNGDGYWDSIEALFYKN